MRRLQLQKNILDLEYHTTLQYFTTTIILVFTYLVGLVIAFLTAQVTYTDAQQVSYIFFITLGVLGTAHFFSSDSLQNFATSWEK